MISYSSVAFLVGLILLGLASLMLIPCAFAWYLGSPDLQAFLISEVTTASTALLLVLSRSGAAPQLRIREMFLFTTAAWVCTCVFGGLPFLFSHTVASATDAVFESVSGATTTGATVLTNIDSLPRDILLWRSMLQWIGGLGIVAFGAAILPYLRIGGMRLFQTESSDFSEKALPLTQRVLFRLLIVYLLFSVCCALAYGAAGMEPFDAVNHAMTTISTGGFSTYDGSIAYFDSRLIDAVSIIFMLIAAVPFMLYLPILAGHFGVPFRNGQVRSMLAAYFFVMVILAVWLASSQQLTGPGDLLDVAFTVVSIATTTGYVKADYTAWGSFAILILFFLTYVGGCTGSTSGGIKIFRFKVAFVMFSETIDRLLHPNAVFPRQVEGRPITDDIIASVMAFSLGFACTVGAAAVLLALAGNDFVTSFSAAATATANVGPGFGDIIGPVSNFSSLSDPSKWILCVAMVLGRLEIFTALILITPSFWRT